MILAAIGICGSGKTYRLQTIVGEVLRQPSETGWRVLVLDVNHEWPGEPLQRAGLPPGTFGAVVTPEGARRALADGSRAVLLRPPGLLGDDDRARELADATAWVAIQHPAPVLLVLPEAHRYAREGRPLPKHIGVIVHQWRHTQTGLIVDTQHFQDLRKEILRECSALWLHAQTHHTSLSRIKEYGGEPLVEQITEATRRMRAGEPGWHVCWMPGETRFELAR